jgi:hypothetical protein
MASSHMLSVSGQQAHQLSVLGFVGTAYERGQLRELSGSCSGEASFGTQAEVLEASVNVLPGRKCDSTGGCEGVQVGGGGRQCQWQLALQRKERHRRIRRGEGW